MNGDAASLANFDLDFDISSPDTQESILRTCKAFKMKNVPAEAAHERRRLYDANGTLDAASRISLQVRGVSSCFMESFAKWVSA